MILRWYGLVGSSDQQSAQATRLRNAFNPYKSRTAQDFEQICAAVLHKDQKALLEESAFLTISTTSKVKKVK